jgi:hypothetical protein
MTASVHQLKRKQSTLFSFTEEPTDAEFCTKLAKSGETALVEELTANALPGGDKAGSQGVQPLVNNAVPVSPLIYYLYYLY